jgi:kynurenine formamidase
MSTSRRRFLKTAVALGGVALSRRAEGWSPQSSVPNAGFGAPSVSRVPLAQESDHPLPTAAEVNEWYTTRRNWGRWGPNDEVGAINMITAEKRRAAAELVRNGKTVSLSRVFEPPQHFVRKNDRGDGAGSFVDYYGFIYHGQTITHIDALCHIWEKESDGVWQGRAPDEAVDTHGAAFGAITAWSDGIITRGVLLDVPRHRGESHVTSEKPVHGWELEEIASAQGVDVRPGDALMVHSGREAFQRSGGSFGGGDRPGLHVSCAKFIRDHDVSLLGWDMMDARPDQYGLRYPVHGVLPNYGVALLDNALLEPLANACVEERRYEFMFMLLPLKVARGTGSPANPIAMF